MLDERDAAWAEVYAALPADWVVLRPLWQETKRVWAVYVRRLTGPKRTVGVWHDAFGQTEAIALRALSQQFRTGLAQTLPILRGKAWIERARK